MPATIAGMTGKGVQKLEQILILVQDWPIALFGGRRMPVEISGLSQELSNAN